MHIHPTGRVPSSRLGRSPRDAGARLLVVALSIAGVACGTATPSGFGGSGESAEATGDGVVPDSGASAAPFGVDSGGGSGPLVFSGEDASVAQPDGGATTAATRALSGMPVSIDDCPGSLSPATVAALQAGGPVSASMKWLYPYDGTVFPGGLVAPTLQWAQSSPPDGVYLHLHSSLFDYTGCFAGGDPPQLAVPQTAWDTAWEQGTGVNDPLSVELTTVAGGVVSGPLRESLVFARGSLKGVVYYNTYTSQIAGDNGAVMSIAPGAATPTVLISIPGIDPVGPCVSCHSVSANGQYLAAQRHDYLFGGANASGLVDSESYDLSSGAAINTGAPLAQVTDDDWGFSAMYPDGSRLLTDGQPNQTSPPFPAAAGNNPGMIGPNPSKMYDPRTGATVPFSGLVAQYAMMPMFSPDGTKVVFNDYDHGAGHSLVVMDFDPATNTFSGAVTVYRDPSLYPGWPFFTPDSREVVFVLGNSDNFASTLDPPAQNVATSDIYFVSATGGTPTALDATNGLIAGQSYLPYPGRDEHLNFYTTVSPVSSGGYFWIYFMSRRSYGNMLASGDATVVVADATDTKSMKIWVSAIQVSETGVVESHPAFYLPGQELVSGNIRAFPALEPCKADGQSCASGIDCCGGACTSLSCGKPMGCSKADEKCATSSDCCDATMKCIGGFCAQPSPM